MLVVKPAISFFIFILLAPLLTFSQESSTEAQKIDAKTRMVIHLLDYLSADYGGAVKDGKILSQGEYDEQVEFIQAIVGSAQELPVMKEHPQLLQDLRHLESRIMAKGPVEEVTSLSAAARKKTVEVSQIALTPSAMPKLHLGKKLFMDNCISCHGVEGRGDGPEGVGLDPAPANFWNQERMKELSAFQAFNTIKLGVPGTGMASFDHFSEEDLWSLSFYILSLRHQNSPLNNLSPQEVAEIQRKAKEAISLQELSVAPEFQLETKLKAAYPEEDKNIPAMIASLRNPSEPGPSDSSGGSASSPHYSMNSLDVAHDRLEKALTFYQNGDFSQAKINAMEAYLEGVEPVEPKLIGAHPELLRKIEAQMTQVRKDISASAPLAQLSGSIEAAKVTLGEIDKALAAKTSSPAAHFSFAFGIVLREGLEAILIILAILGVMGAAGNQREKKYVHAGWISALVLGGLAWIFSGYLMKLGGAGRELIESVTSMVAVAILLYMGFWLHQKTEIGKWNKYIHDKTHKVLSSGNLLGIMTVSFMAVFREALETVFFLRTLWIEDLEGPKTPIVAGVGLAFVLIFALTWVYIKFSKVIPLKKLFTFSSFLLLLLSIILTGKGIHSMQEIGWVGMTPLPASSWAALSSQTLGLYPTWETLLGQLSVLFLCVILVNWEKMTAILKGKNLKDVPG